jgi:predicted tellurium resistance membrane protein TerC
MATPDPIPQIQPTPEQMAAKREAEKQQRSILIWGIVFLVLLLAGIITAIYFLLRPETPVEQVGRIRDIFLIFMAFESLLIGAALIVLIVQVSSLINLMQNEVRPILQATTETVNNLRGTAEFLGENVVQPVIKLNGYLAGLQRVIELMGIKRR